MNPGARKLHRWCDEEDVGATKARELIKRGELEAVRVGRSVLITNEATEKWRRSLPSAT